MWWHRRKRHRFFIPLLLSSVLVTEGHVAPWHKGMYCLNGTSGYPNLDANEAVQPLYMLKESDWWFHHIDKCDAFPPAPGDFLELPANGQFTVEFAVNRAHTTLSYNGVKTGLYMDGQNHPDFGISSDGKQNGSDCITEPNIHTQNESMAAGTAFAISHVSDMRQVTKANLVVFTILPNSPWRRVATFQVPNLPACPPNGCICAWGWVPYGCGIPNMYMTGFRCRVVGLTGDAAVGPGVPPVYCEADQSKCVKGPKQMVFWNQQEGNNVEVSGLDLAGQPKSPTYNWKMGFQPGAQNDIFMKKGTADPTKISPSTPTKSSSFSIHETFTYSFIKLSLTLLTIILLS